jgi:hypothetical protein
VERKHQAIVVVVVVGALEGTKSSEKTGRGGGGGGGAGGGEDKTWVCVAMANSVYNILPVDNPLADHAALLFPEVCGILLFLSVSLSLPLCVYACE